MNASAPPLLAASAALFLDFDGTLVAMAPRPQDVQVSAWVLPTLQALMHRQGGALALVSGRPLVQLDAFLAPLVLPSAGAHGAEWRSAAGAVERIDAVPPRSVAQAAQALVNEHHGLIFEPKPAGFAVHFRARPALESVCRERLDASLSAVPGASEDWAWLRGHFVFELKRKNISKGQAVEHLMRTEPFASRLPVFVGDDQTDEDGIAVAQARGGYGVRVGGGESQALHRLPDVDAVGDWLRSALQSSREKA